MTKKDTETEEAIKRAAKQLFFVEGRFNATTQEIADAAGVNRTFLNYYFRSRNKLFDLVLKDARQQFRQRMKFVFHSDLSFKDKIERFIEFFLTKAVAKRLLYFLLNKTVTVLPASPSWGSEIFKVVKPSVDWADFPE